MFAKVIVAWTAFVVLMSQCGWAAAQSGAVLPGAHFAAIPVSERPLLEIDTLRANAENATRLVASLDEMKGIDHLRRLADASPIEEQWAYLPEADLWIELGVAEAGPQVQTDADYLEKILGRFNAIHLYHFHPAELFDASRPETTALALPSPTDVQSSLAIARLQQKLNPGAEVRNFVVSPHGVVEYEPTSLGRARIAREENYPLASTERDLLTLIAVRRSSFNVSRTLERINSTDPSALVFALCSQLASDVYVMSYQPNGGAT